MDTGDRKWTKMFTRMADRFAAMEKALFAAWLNLQSGTVTARGQRWFSVLDRQIASLDRIVHRARDLDLVGTQELDNPIGSQSSR